MLPSRMRKWRRSEIIIVTVVAAPFAFLAWSAWRSSVYDAALEQRVRTSFQPVECDIKAVSWTELRSRPSGGGGSQSAATVVSGYDLHVEFAYEIKEQPYLSRRIRPRYQTIPTRAEVDAFLARYPVRAGYTCYYDPDKPSMAFLER